MTFTKLALLRRYHRPADDGTDLPGTADYGDDFTPTDDDADAARTARGADADDAGSASGRKDGADGEGGEDADEGEPLRAAADDLAAKDEGANKESTGTPRTGKGKFIPLERHEKLLKKERARREELEAQLQQSRAGREMAAANETLSQQVVVLLLHRRQLVFDLAEGDTKAATRMMTEIRRKNAELNAATIAQRDAEIMARAVEKVRYDEALDRIERAYPQLDPDSEEYDEDVYQDVVDLMQAGQRRGLSATKALQRAVDRVLGADTSAQKRATTTTPRVSEEDVAAQRRGEAVKRNLDAARRQPPATHRAGAGNDVAGGALTAKAVMEMSEEDFNKLSEKDLAKLRGDEL